ncbi:MAG TPA: hypothetical protein VI731_10535 [Bacteroidia bacterium]|nr:hypothetical protein [Bacteroidia bacterium]
MFDLENLTYLRTVHPFEWVLLVIYTVLLLGISFFSQVKNIRHDALYRYYMLGLLAKIFSAVVFCLVYIYYYHGGDTVSYFETSRALVNLGLENWGYMLRVMFTPPSAENYSLFDSSTGYPWTYMFYDPQTFFVAKLIAPILFISFKSYLVSTVVLSWLSFFGIWRLFKMMCRYYPAIDKRIAFAVLFLPSVLFWGSGILKDTVTFSAVCWFIVSLDSLAILKQKRVKNGIILIVSVFVLASVKPYILISLLPGAIVWVFYSRISKIRSRFIKVVSIPFIYVASIGIGIGLLAALGDKLGKFSLEKMLVTASVTQKDLKQDYYRGSSFDIGDFEPTIGGAVGKAPAALIVGLYRPFIWEARNVVMLISGLENLLYLFLSTVLVFRMITDPRRFFKVLLQNPILIFLLSYAVLFSILVGLSTSNFGALVRFKIPFLPAFVSFLLILNYYLGTDAIARERQSRLAAKRLKGITT